MEALINSRAAEYAEAVEAASRRAPKIQSPSSPERYPRYLEALATADENPLKNQGAARGELRRAPPAAGRISTDVETDGVSSTRVEEIVSMPI